MESNTNNTDRNNRIKKMSEMELRKPRDIIQASKGTYLVRMDMSLIRLDKVRIKGANRKKRATKNLEKYASKSFNLKDYV